MMRKLNPKNVGTNKKSIKCLGLAVKTRVGLDYGNNKIFLGLTLTPPAIRHWVT